MGKTRMESGYDAVSSNSRSEILYQEAWRQYVHEDSLVLRRSTIYLAVQGAVLASTGVVGPSLVRAGNAMNTMVGVNLGAVFFGVYLLFAASLSLVVCVSWRYITNAGEQWIHLRRNVAVAIERLWGLDSVGVGCLEDRWWAHKKKSLVGRFAKKKPLVQLFPDDVRLGDIWLSAPGVEGFAAQRFMISTLMLIWIGIALIGCLVILWGSHSVPQLYRLLEKVL